MPSFKLPPNWYRLTVEHLVDDVLPDVLGPLTPQSAWRYVYACVLWRQMLDGEEYLHLNDRLSSASGRSLARRGEEYLRRHLLHDRAGDFREHLDQIGKAYAAERVRQGKSGDQKHWQRNNVTGNGFEATLQVLIQRITGVWPSRTPELRTLRGFELAPTGYHSRPDLVLFSPADFRILISTKWTLRKERLGTYLHEAYFYRQRRADLQVAFVVSEFNLNILEWLVGDPLVDRAYHVHLPMLLDAHEPFLQAADHGKVDREELLSGSTREVKAYRRWSSIRTKLFDLEQLFADINVLQAVGDAVTLDPLWPDDEALDDEDE